MDELQKLYDVLSRDGYYTKSFEEFQAQYEDPAYRDKVFGVITRDGLYTNSREEFDVKYSPLKKKENVSDSVQQQNLLDSLYGAEGESIDLDLASLTSPNPDAETNFIGGKVGDFLNRASAFAIANNNPFLAEVIDFADDMARSFYIGQGQGSTIDETLALITAGSNVDREIVSEYIDAITESQRVQQVAGQSQEMQDFNEIYEREGRGVLGFVKGLAKNPSVLPQVALQSFAGMLNPTSLTEAGVVLGGGAVTGIGGGPATVVAGAARAVPTALSVVGGTIETTASFTEFLMEELGDKEFNDENVLAVLQNPEAFSRIRNRSLARGATISATDFIGGSLTRALGGQVLTRTARTGFIPDPVKVGAVGAVSESLTGAGGETLARILVGQELDVAEIGFEGLGNIPQASLSVGSTLITGPRYRVNGAKASKNQVLEIIETAAKNPEQIKDGVLDAIEVTRDPQLAAIIGAIKEQSAIDAEIPPIVVGQDRAKLITLEQERRRLSGSDLVSSKRRAKEIDAEIDAIMTKAKEDAEAKPVEPKPAEPIDTKTPEPSPIPPPAPDDTAPQPSAPRSLLGRLLNRRGRRDVTLSGDASGQKVNFDSLKRKLRRAWNNTFKSNSGLDSNTAEVIRQLARDKAAFTEAINRELNALNAIRRKAGRKVGRDEEDLRLNAINEYLQGKEVNLDFLNEEDIATLNYSREKIDNLSDQIITVLEQRLQDASEGRIVLTEKQQEATADVIETIKQNKGQYLRRSYQAFSDAEFLNQYRVPLDKMSANAKKRFDAAVQLLVTENKVDEQTAIRQVSEYIESIATKSTSELGLGPQGSARAPFLRKKNEDIPVEFRQLLGEIKDPLKNYANTTSKLENYLASIQYQQSLHDLLVESGIASTEQAPGLTPLSPDSEEWSYLNGLYVPLEVKQAMEDMAGLGPMKNDFFGVLGKIAQAGKLSKTVLSPTTAFRNVYSGLFLALNSGHYTLLNVGTKEGRTNLQRSVITAFGSKKSKKELQLEREELIRLGVLGDASRAGELVAILNDLSIANDKGVINIAKRLYAFGDDFYKVSGFYTERKRLMEAGLTEEAATAKAAQRIRNSYPTYSYVPRNIQKLRRNPLIGSFVSFPYEVVRTTKNNLLYVAEDLRAGRKKMAMQRASGMILANGALTALSLGTRNLLGLSDEDDENIKSLNPPYSADSELIYTGITEEGVNFIDGTAIFPSEVIIKPLRMIFDNPDADNLAERVEEMLYETATPYISLDLTTKAFKELRDNQDEYGRKIYDEGAGPTDSKLMNGFFHSEKGPGQILNYYAKKAGPGIYNNVQELGRAVGLAPSVFGEKTTRYRDYTVEDALYGFFGFRRTHMNFGISLRGKITDLSSDHRYKIARLKYPLFGKRELSTDEVNEIFQSVLAQNALYSDEVIRYMGTAKGLGMTDEKIRAVFPNNVASADVEDFIELKPIPPKPITRQKIQSEANRTIDDGELRDKTEEEIEIDLEVAEKNIDIYSKLIDDYYKQLEKSQPKGVLELRPGVGIFGKRSKRARNPITGERQ
jgi:hypothetical protein